MSDGGDAVSRIEVAFDHAGRLCRNLLIREPRLTHQQVRKLTQWLYGCMNQRYTIRRRVADRGVAEIGKVLKFAAGALAAVREIQAQLESQK